MVFNRKCFSLFCGFFIVLAFYLPVALLAQASPTLNQTADSAVNTKYNEIKPLLSPDGKTFYFTRSNHPLNAGGKRDKGDVWTAQMQPGGDYTNAKLAASTFNSSKLNMVIGFSADGKEIYFQNYDPETKGKRQAGIFKVPVNGSSPKEVTIHYFFNGAKYQDATISANGKVMLLSMESYSTFGLEDLYVSFLQPDGSWSEPKNIGQDINTPKQEMSAWVSSDGKTLYFSSNGHGGNGSMDIFKSSRLDDSWKRWTKPVNLGPSVNSPGADIYYSEAAKGKWAFYSTTMNSEGYGDLKRIPIPDVREAPEEVIEEASPIVFQAESPSAADEVLQEDSVHDVTVLVKQSFELKGKIMNEEGDVQAGNIKISKNAGPFFEESVTSGTFNVNLPEAGAYDIKIQSAGYHPVDTAVQVNEGATELTFNLRPIKVGETVLLQNVMFRQSTAVLVEESNASLDGVVELMKENPGMEILLTGHTDNQGNSKSNIKLSRERVETVKNYLISRGIEEGRIEGKGFGGTRPVASNANEESRKLNRRVEFVITKK